MRQALPSSRQGEHRTCDSRENVGREVHVGGSDFQEGEMEGWGGQLPGVALSLQPVLARRSGRVRRGKAIPREGVVGGGVSQRKPHIIEEAEGRSHEDVKEEELADDRAQESTVESLGEGECRVLCRGPMELR